MNKPGKQKYSQIADADNGAEKGRQFKGVRLRKWGKWVSEVRVPNCRDKIWLGSYDTAEQAARAFDAAAFCLRGFHANLNFPDTVPAIPSPSSLSRRQIQQAAAKYARGQIASTCKNSNDVMVELEKPLSPPISSSSTVQEMETSIDSLLMSEKPEFEFWESLFRHSECNQLLNLDNLLSLDVD